MNRKMSALIEQLSPVTLQRTKKCPMNDFLGHYTSEECNKSIQKNGLYLVYYLGDSSPPFRVNSKEVMNRGIPTQQRH